LEYVAERWLKAPFNVFWGMPHLLQAGDLHKPNLIHNIYLGILKYLMEWIEGLLEKHKRQQQFDEVWMSMPPFPGLTRPTKAYQEVTQW
jgi:hypothetical protein